MVVNEHADVASDVGVEIVVVDADEGLVVVGLLSWLKEEVEPQALRGEDIKVFILRELALE